MLTVTEITGYYKRIKWSYDSFEIVMNNRIISKAEIPTEVKKRILFVIILLLFYLTVKKIILKQASEEKHLSDSKK